MADKISRKVGHIMPADQVTEGAGVKVKRTIGSQHLNYLDPFLLLDEFRSDNPEDYIRGFPDHPHRGIETVSYIIDREVSHKDSIGNAGIIGPGDAQWMTSGRGIIHSEMPKGIKDRLWGYQLWVNLPAKLKMSEPRYQDVPAAEIPTAELENGIKIRVLTGSVGEVKGPVSDIAADPTYLDVSVPAGGSFSHPVPKGHTVFAYVIDGSGEFGPEGESKPAEVSQIVVFEDGEYVQAKAGVESFRFLLVSGKPLGEPIARWGPFVMNTGQEIDQALDELRNGTFLDPK